MKVSLWVLVDSGGRIWYTGSSKYEVENAPNRQYGNGVTFYTIELKGKINV
jgi:hypothetical protein